MKTTTVHCDNCGEEILSDRKGCPNFRLMFGDYCSMDIRSECIGDICLTCRKIIVSTLVTQMKMIDRQSLAYKQTLAVELKGNQDPK